MYVKVKCEKCGRIIFKRFDEYEKPIDANGYCNLCKKESFFKLIEA